MFYTGSRFLEPGRITNVETVLAATSGDLTEWVKDPGVVVAADPRWYETLAAGTWHEEAWRDPWVFADPDGDGWHMLVTARAVDGPGRDRGVVGHAWSPDLVRWEVRPPRSTPGTGFAHLEVPQVVEVDGRWALVFSCDSAHLAGHREGERGGIWAVALDDPRARTTSAARPSSPARTSTAVGSPRAPTGAPCCWRSRTSPRTGPSSAPCPTRSRSRGTATAS